MTRVVMKETGAPDPSGEPLASLCGPSAGICSEYKHDAPASVSEAETHSLARRACKRCAEQDWVGSRFRVYLHKETVYHRKRLPTGFAQKMVPRWVPLLACPAV